MVYLQNILFSRYPVQLGFCLSFQGWVIGNEQKLPSYTNAMCCEQSMQSHSSYFDGNDEEEESNIVSFIRWSRQKAESVPFVKQNCCNRRHWKTFTLIIDASFTFRFLYNVLWYQTKICYFCTFVHYHHGWFISIPWVIL